LWPSKIGTRRGDVIKDAPLQKTLPTQPASRPCCEALVANDMEYRQSGPLQVTRPARAESTGRKGWSLALARLSVPLMMMRALEVTLR
jgi:hypothetical protein